MVETAGLEEGKNWIRHFKYMLSIKTSEEAIAVSQALNNISFDTDHCGKSGLGPKANRLAFESLHLTALWFYSKSP